MKTPTTAHGARPPSPSRRERSAAVPSTNRPCQQDRFRKIVAAIPRYLSNLTQIILAGVTFTPASLVQFFLDQIKMLDDATAARAALHSASQAIKAAKGTKGPILKAF